MLNPISTIKANLGIDQNGRVQKFFTRTCAKYMDKYVPYDTGATSQSGLNNYGDDYVQYQTEYAEKIYNGTNIKFHTDIHLYAGPYWDKRMVSAEMQDVVKEVQNYVRRG